MTSERLGEMFEGANANMCAKNIPLVLTVGQRPVKRMQKGSAEPHWRRNFFPLI